MGVKISQLQEATTINEADIIPIVQDSTTKKVTKQTLFSSTMGAMANEYSVSSTYQVGDYVVYDGILYKCITQISTAEEWDSSKWQVAELGSVVANVNRIVSDIFNLIYPVGHIILTDNSTNPGTIFGGTWELFAVGKCVFGVDPTQTEFATPGLTGGSKYLQEHTHEDTKKWSDAGGTYGYTDAYPYFSNKGTADAKIGSGGVKDVATGNAGNLPPYVTAYYWKRIA